jgi:hypothetical protein
MGRKLIIYPDTCFYGRPFDRPQTPELLAEERTRLWAESKNYEDFTGKAIAYGKLTGDFTIDRHILPEPSFEDIRAQIDRNRALHPERQTVKPRQVRG